MNNKNIDLLMVARCEWIARFLALAVVALGLLVLAGWMLDILPLKSVMAGWVTMKANTALAFVLAGASLFFAGHRPRAAVWRNTQVGLAVAVASLGLLTLGEYLFGINLGIDQLLVNAAPDPLADAAPGRMAAITAAGFILSGLALATIDGALMRVVSVVAALSASLIGMLVVLGYAYGVAALYGVGAYSSVALHSALGFIALNLGVLLARPQGGLMAVVISDTAGGVMARRLLPFALIAPFLIGWLRIIGEKRGLYSSEFGVALVALTYVALFVTIIWRTAAMLAASDQKLRDFYQLSPMGIVLTDMTGNYVESNQAFRDINGFSEAELRDINFWKLASRVEQARHVASLERTGLYGPDENTHLRKDGGPVPVRLGGMLVTGKHGKQYVWSVVEDITERKQAEQMQVRRIIEAAPDPMLLVGSGGTILFANKAAQSTFCYTLSELTGQNVDQLVPLRNRRGHAHSRRIFENDIHQHPAYKSPLTALRQDGSEFPVEISLSRLQMNGQPVVIANVRNVTERRRAAELLQQSFTQLRRLSDHQQDVKERERKRIAQDIHDELGQNLLALKMDVAMLHARTAVAHPKLHRRVALVLDNINTTIKSLKLIMNELRPATLELGLFPAVEWQLKQFERSSGIACTLVATEDAEFGLDEASTSAVFRILQESLTNVARHAQASEVEITLRRDEHGFLMMVRDDGKGIEADDRRKSNSFGLMGIKERANALGGEFTIASSPDSGTVLSVFIAATAELSVSSI